MIANSVALNAGKTEFIIFKGTSSAIPCWHWFVYSLGGRPCGAPSVSLPQEP